LSGARDIQPTHPGESSTAVRDPNFEGRKLKVGLATSGRFHLLDLARELDVLGADIRFYSYVSRKRASLFGLPGRCHVAFLPFLFPLVALERLLPSFFPLLIERLMCWALDIAAICRMRKCDVLICMSGIYVLAPLYAKWRFGARIHLHRSSRHILSQKEILANLPRSQQVSSFMEKRELRGYAIADRIIVPSTHVVESFAPWPDCSAKLFLNPLGVDVEQFPLRKEIPASDHITVLFVGQWSYRKGVDVLVEAVRTMSGVRLVHVGALADAPFPTEPVFVHHDHVAQQALPQYYAMAHMFVLPSREDGFGVVLSQALSSGLPVICTDRTGGPDLAKLPMLSRLIRIVRAASVPALRQAIERTIEECVINREIAPITEAERQLLGWRAYASRDLAFMKQMLQSSPKPPE
jgi:starch synthase